MKKIILFIILFFSIQNNSFSAITFDAVSESSAASAFSITKAHTIGSGSNRILIATYAQENGTNCSSVTYNGQSLTNVGTVTNSVNSAQIWYLLEANLPTAGTYNAVFTCNNGQSFTISVITLFGAKQEAPEASSTNTNSASATITSSITTLSANAWVVDVISAGEDAAFTTTEAGQTERHDLGAGTTMRGASSTKETTTAGSTNMGWSGGGTNRKAHMLISIAPFVETVTNTTINGATINGATIN